MFKNIRLVLDQNQFRWLESTGIDRHVIIVTLLMATAIILAVFPVQEVWEVVKSVF